MMLNQHMTYAVTFKSLMATKIMDFERDEGCLDEHEWDFQHQVMDLKQKQIGFFVTLAMNVARHAQRRPSATWTRVQWCLMTKNKELRQKKQRQP